MPDIFYTLGIGQQKFKFVLHFVIAFQPQFAIPEILFYSLYTADIQILYYIDTILTLHPYLMKHNKLTLRH
jgi:hypothetical protein